MGIFLALWMGDESGHVDAEPDTWELGLWDIYYRSDTTHLVLYILRNLLLVPRGS